MSAISVLRELCSYSDGTQQHKMKNVEPSCWHLNIFRAHSLTNTFGLAEIEGMIMFDSKY